LLLMSVTKRGTFFTVALLFLKKMSTDLVLCVLRIFATAQSWDIKSSAVFMLLFCLNCLAYTTWSCADKIRRAKQMIVSDTVVLRQKGPDVDFDTSRACASERIE